jgi:hypothetical protein
MPLNSINKYKNLLDLPLEPSQTKFRPKKLMRKKKFQNKSKRKKTRRNDAFFIEFLISFH